MCMTSIMDSDIRWAILFLLGALLLLLINDGVEILSYLTALACMATAFFLILRKITRL